MGALIAVLIVPVALFLLAVRVRRSRAARVTLIILALLVIGLIASVLPVYRGGICCDPEPSPAPPTPAGTSQQDGPPGGRAASARPAGAVPGAGGAVRS